MGLHHDRGVDEFESEDALLLRELTLRASFEVAAAAAAMGLARAATERRGRRRLIGAALSRLHGFGELNRLLGRPLRDRVDVACELTEVCVALGHGRILGATSRMLLDFGSVWVSALVARRLLVVAASLLEDVLGATSRIDGGCIRVTLAKARGEVALTVQDDRVGPRLFGADASANVRRALAAELVGRCAGLMSVTTGRSGTRFIVTMPSGLAGERDEGVSF